MVEHRGPLVGTPVSYSEGLGTDLGPKLMHIGVAVGEGGRRLLVFKARGTAVSADRVDAGSQTSFC